MCNKYEKMIFLSIYLNYFIIYNLIILQYVIDLITFSLIIIMLIEIIKFGLFIYNYLKTDWTFNKGCAVIRNIVGRPTSHAIPLQLDDQL